MKNAKIVHLTSVHPAFDIRVFHKECVTLAKAGYETVLIVPHEKDETVDGVRIRAIPKPKNRLERTFRSTWQVLVAALREKADVYHFHDPELIPIGLLLKLLGKRVIYDVHENVREDILTKDYIPLVLRKSLASMIGFIERAGAMFFDGIVAATPAIARNFPGNGTLTVQNFPMFDDSLSINSPYRERPFLAAYVGGVTLIRGIKEIVQALALLPDTVNAKIIVAASFSPPELEEEMKRMPGWERVEFVGWLPTDEVPDVLAQARAGLVLFHPVPNHLNAQPHKLFDYMSAGIPVIASDFPLWREIVEGGSCGIVVDPLNPQAIARVMQWIWEHPAEAEALGFAGKEAAVSLFNWTKESAKLLDLYRGLLYLERANLGGVKTS